MNSCKPFRAIVADCRPLFSAFAFSNSIRRASIASALTSTFSVCIGGKPLAARERQDITAAAT